MAQSNASTTLLQIPHIAHAHIGIVYTEWNEAIVAEQRKGCARILAAAKATLVHELAVPGSFELPFGCRLMAERFIKGKEKPEAIIAFGAVIRGGTPHFEYVCQAATTGILQLNLTLSIPVIFGVLTLDSEAQAWERLGGVHGHKGEEAAITALKMIDIARQCRDSRELF